MAIEPLASAMTYTAQQTQTAETAPKASEIADGTKIEAEAPKIDAQTLTVARTTNAADDNAGNSEGSTTNSGAEYKANQELLKKAFEELNKKSTTFESEFGIHEKTHRITVKIVDKKTKEVIKELPPEKTLDMIAKVWEMAGLIVDEKR